MKTFAALLIALLVAPSAFFIAPQSVYAQVPISSLGPNDFLSVAKETLSSIHTFTSAVANEALVFNAYVLQPLAFVLSGDILKKITAGVISFVIGATNGTGAPQFVQNLQGHLQRVGDTGALAFFVQFGRNSNSPFASAITSSLQRNYLYNTSSAGFFAANRSTLGLVSTDINAFLSGDWSKGGINAWFALTTQSNNNPYILHQAAQTQLASVVAGARAARVTELNWGRGFLSWCGPAVSGDTQGLTEGAAALGIGGGGTAPGDACRNEDGTWGTVKTPGSVIQETLDRTLGGTQEKLVQMGQLANEVSAILGNIGTIMNTVNSVTQILGGTDSGGLFGMGQTSGTNNTTRLVQYQDTPFLGTTQTQVYQTAARLPASGSDMLSRVVQYEEAWSTLRSAANAASAALTDLANYCIAQQSVAPSVLSNGYGQSLESFISVSTAQANAAYAAIATQIVPILAQVDKAFTDATAARALVQKIETELNSSDPAVMSAYNTDIQTLQTMTPTNLDVSEAQQDTQSYNSAVAVPAGSLTVVNGTIVDQMALISTNAATLKSTVCTPAYVPPPDDSNGTFIYDAPG